MTSRDSSLEGIHQKIHPPCREKVRRDSLSTIITFDGSVKKGKKNPWPISMDPLLLPICTWAIQILITNGDAGATTGNTGGPWDPGWGGEPG